MYDEKSHGLSLCDFSILSRDVRLEELTYLLSNSNKVDCWFTRLHLKEMLRSG